MKRKIISLVLILGVIFCLTGCKGKNQVLTCSKKTPGGWITETRIYSYVDGKLASAKGKFYYDESEAGDESWEILKEEYSKTKYYCTLTSKQVRDYETVTKCKQKIGDKYAFTINEYDVEEILESYASDWFSTYEAAKDYFTNTQGFTCE